MSETTTVKLVGGRIFLDFINTVAFRGSPNSEDRLADLDILLGWSRRAGIIDEGEANRFLADSDAGDRQSWLRRAVKLREALHRIAISVIEKENPSPDDLELLNREFGKSLSHRRLAVHGDKFVWSWSGENAIDKIFRTIAASAVEFLAEGDLSRLRRCGGENCGWLFEDTTRNRSRTWCDMKDCGNLAKIRRFRQKRTN